MARTPDPLLHYSAPVLRRPGVLVAAEWLNYFAAQACVAYLAVGGLLLRIGLAARAGRSSVRLLGVLMWGTPDQVFLGATTIGYGIAFGAAALFIALSIRALRRRRLTRGLALGLSLFFPMGTVAGLFTFIVLGGPAVRATYGERESPHGT